MKDIPNSGVFIWMTKILKSKSIRRTLVAAVCVPFLTATVRSQEGAVEDRLTRVEQELERQRQENAKLRQELEVIDRRQFEAGEGREDLDDDQTSSPDTLRGKASESDEHLGSKGGIFSKPFLTSIQRRAYLGGYIDLEYFDSQNSDRRFTQHRFIPFIYVDATDKLKFAAEIEFEYGGSDSAGDDGETKVEFATMDYIFHESFAFRAGAILVPLGKFNLIHDSPVNDLTARPLVNRLVIPTTLTEAGAGFFGTLPPAGDWEISYEAYAVNGFTGLDRDGTGHFNNTKGLRNGRSSLKVDNNNSGAGVGRIAISPFLGSEIGASAHIGKYDEAGDLSLAVWAIDWIFKPGRFVEALTPFELQGEFASAELERNTLARDADVPSELWGAYGQLNYHFMPDYLRDVLPSVFTEESTFTLVHRIDHVDIDSNRIERLSYGLNFRPIEDTVFKFEYQFNLEDWSRRKVDNDTVALSVATYF